MPKWLQYIIILGVALDLIISGVLLTQQGQIDHNAQKNDCWSHILDTAITKAPLTPSDRVQLTTDARKCVKLP